MDHGYCCESFNQATNQPTNQPNLINTLIINEYSPQGPIANVFFLISPPSLQHVLQLYLSSEFEFFATMMSPTMSVPLPPPHLQRGLRQSWLQRLHRRQTMKAQGLDGLNGLHGLGLDLDPILALHSPRSLNALRGHLISYGEGQRGWVSSGLMALVC